MRNWLIMGLTGVALLAPAAASRRALGQTAAPDDVALQRLCDEDQADRATRTIDWTVVGPRDRARLARVRELYLSGEMHTAGDYYHGALVLQHSDAADDFLLAHEFCVAAMMLGKNDRAASSLAVAAEDRFLMNIG